MPHLRFIVGVLAFIFFPTSAMASVTGSSYLHAREAVEQAIEAAGIAEWLAHPAPILVESRGTVDLSAVQPSFAAGQPAIVAYHEIWVWDPRSGIVAREQRLGAEGSEDAWEREIFLRPETQVTIEMPFISSAITSTPEIAARAKTTLYRAPALLLAEAMNQVTALRFNGRHGPFDGIEVQTRENQTLGVFITRESKQVGWVEYIAKLPALGDSSVSWRFGDYRHVAGIGQWPHHNLVQINDQDYLDMKVVRISTDAAEVSAFLEAGTDEP